jgi:hypothetical protein
VSERWAKPPVVYDVEPDPDRFTLTGDGRLFSEVKLTVDADTMARLRQGYLCANCLQPHSEAMPEQCSLCGFEIRAQQTDWLSAHFHGRELIGSKVKLADELARLRGE